MNDLATRLRRQRTVRWMGLMSGTSCDGIDVAVLDLQERSGELPRATFVHGGEYPFRASDSRRLIEALRRDPTVSSAAVWDAWLGEKFADTARRSIDRDGPVDAIVVSGHTFAHQPDQRATLQLGNPALVAVATGCPVVAGMRAADVARGGEGAPLVPAGDRILFARDDGPVAVVNLGGISNVTWLPDRRGWPAAADCGPSNLILNRIVHLATGGDESFDHDGARTAAGVVHEELIRGWMAHPFFGSARRSTGREEFGEEWVLEHHDELSALSLADRLATVADWIAECVSVQIHRFGGAADTEVLVGGGGAFNLGVMNAIGRRFERVEVLCEEDHGVSESLREAAAFAVLGHELLHRRAGSFPTTTGCRGPGPIGAWW